MARRTPTAAPLSPEIRPLLRRQLIATGVDETTADKLLDFARQEGLRLRAERLEREKRKKMAGLMLLGGAIVWVVFCAWWAQKHRR